MSGPIPTRFLADQSDASRTDALRIVAIEVSGPADLATDRQRHFLEGIDAGPRIGRYPRYDLIDPVVFWRCLGYLHKVEHIPERHDFVYRIYGSDVARIASLEMNGRTVSEHPGRTGEALLSNYRGLLADPKIVRTEIEVVGEVGVRRWSRVVCPAVDSAGAVVGFLVVAEPVVPYEPLPQVRSRRGLGKLIPLFGRA